MFGFKRVLTVAIAACVAALATAGAAHAAHEQLFASVYLGGDKVGQVHVRQLRGADGDIEEVRARASLSFLGATLYEFTHDAKETWQGGALQSLSSRADDNGEIDIVSIRRGDDALVGTRNGAPAELPLEAFPNSLWNYAIVEQTLLFNVITLRLMRVSVRRDEDAVILGGASVPADRFTFSGDYQATVWFGKDRRFLQARYTISGRTIEVRLDP